MIYKHQAVYQEGDEKLSHLIEIHDDDGQNIDCLDPYPIKKFNYATQ